MSVTMPDSVSLGEARQWLRDRMYDGERCPCCRQTAAVRKWTLYDTAIRQLLLMYRLGGTSRWVTARELKDAGHTGQGDGTRLKHWGLAVQGKRGFWRVTDLGESFLRGEVAVREHVDVYDNAVYKTYGDHVYIHRFVGKQFDLAEHLRGAM